MRWCWMVAYSMYGDELYSDDTALNLYVLKIEILDIQWPDENK